MDQEYRCPDISGEAAKKECEHLPGGLQSVKVDKNNHYLDYGRPPAPGCMQSKVTASGGEKCLPESSQNYIKAWRSKVPDLY
jgi:hypothetical protein